MTVQFHPTTGNRGIEWTDDTRNVIGGCLHRCRWQMPDGSIAGCYAKQLAESGVAKSGYPHGFEHHYWRLGQLNALSKGTEPLLVFCDSMSDMFAPTVPAEQVRLVLETMRKAPHHSYQVLTKAAPQILKHIDHLPPNLWVGVSSPPDWMMGNRLSRHQQAAMLRKSLAVLAEVKKRTGNIVWLSAEPVSWDLTDVIDETHPLDWIVIGAASNGRRYFQPDPEHIRNLLTVMDKSKTPVFFKGNIEKLFEGNDLGAEELNRWREDFPPAYRDGTHIPAVQHRDEMCQQHGWTRSQFRAPVIETEQQSEGDACGSTAAS